MTTIARQSLLLAWKDTRIFFKDRMALAFAFLLPFVFVIGFSLALQGAGPDHAPLRFTITTQETGGISGQTIETITAAAPESIAAMAHPDAQAAAANGEINGFVTFPPDFTQRLLSGQPAALQVITGPNAAPADEAALRGFAQEIAARLNEAAAALSAITAISGPQTAPAPSAETAANAIGNPQAAALEPLLSAANALSGSIQVQQVGDILPFNASNFALPGYLTMFVFFTAAMGAEALARERQTHTLERLMSNGARRESLILGKFLAGAIIGVTQIAVMWTVGALAFNINLGAAPAAVILLSLLMAIASAAFGAMLASFVRSVRAAAAAGVLTSLILAPLGGCWWPLFITPPIMQSLARLTPHGWANGGLNKLMLFGAQFTDVAPEMAALTAFAALFLAIALYRFRPTPAN